MSWAASRVACGTRAQAVGTVEEDIRFACSLDAGSQGLGTGMSWREELRLVSVPPFGDMIKVSLDPSDLEVLIVRVACCLLIDACFLDFWLSWVEEFCVCFELLFLPSYLFCRCSFCSFAKLAAGRLARTLCRLLPFVDLYVISQYCLQSTAFKHFLLPAPSPQSKYIELATGTAFSYKLSISATQNSSLSLRRLSTACHCHPWRRYKARLRTASPGASL
ncbi:hypothetical protein V8C42DRAFT_45903 [Trichoderma barbatum]